MSKPNKPEYPEPDIHGAGGEFTQFIPIEVPKYRGIEPKLGLAYNSSNKSRANADAILGVGWSLTGVSKIDKVSLGGGVPFWDPGQDLYRLDGQELMACSANWSEDYPLAYKTDLPSASCSAGGHFSTQVESFRKIEYVPSVNAFRVTDPDGTVSVYRPVSYFTDADEAATADTSDIRLARRSKWLLAEVRDLSGNKVTYDYAIASSAGYAERIGSITYDNGYKISFLYTVDPQAERIPNYATGTKQFARQSRQLSTITVTDGSSKIRAYRLTYDRAEYTLARRLARVIPYGGNYVVEDNLVTGGDSLPSYSFEYTDDGYDVTRRNYPDLLVHGDYRVVDYNYNGVEEVAVLKSQFGQKSTATGEFLSSTDVAGVTFWFNAYDRSEPLKRGRALKGKCEVGSAGGMAIDFRSCDGEPLVDFLGNRRGLSPHTSLIVHTIKDSYVSDNGNQLAKSAIFVAIEEENSILKADRYRETSVYTLPTSSPRVDKGLRANLDLDPDTEFFGLMPGDYAITSVVDGKFQDESWSGTEPSGTQMDVDGNGVDDFVGGAPFRDLLGRWSLGAPVIRRTRPSDGFYNGAWKHRGAADSIAATTFNRADFFTEKSKFIGIWDMNGDGTQDFVFYEGNYNGADSVYIQHGSGVGFTAPQRMPVRNVANEPYTWVHLDADSTQATDFEITDLNNDGLPDLLVKFLTETPQSNMTCTDSTPPITYVAVPCVQVQPQTVRDADVFLNTGLTFRKVNLRVDGNPLARVLGTGDFDGNGVKDLLLHSNGWGNDHGPASVYFGTSPVANLMTKVNLPTGGAIAVAYRGSPYDSDRTASEKSEIPGVRQIVDRITKTDGLGGSATWIYDYAGANYDFVRRKSLGYANVIIRMPEGDHGDPRPRIELTYDNGHIGEARKLRERKVVIGADTVYEHTSYDYERVWTTGDKGPFRTVLKEVRSRTLFGDVRVMSVKEFQWNRYGQQTMMVDRGFVAGVGSNLTPVGEVTAHVFKYKANAEDLDKYIVNRVAFEHFQIVPNKSALIENIVTDNRANWLWAKDYIYDGGAENLTRGLLTEVKEWFRAADDTGNGSWRITAKFGYDDFGNKRWEEDAKGARTQYEYGQKDFFLTKVTNALGHVTRTLWDTACQKPDTVTAPDKVRSITSYDLHCREIRSALKPPKPDEPAADLPAIRMTTTEYLSFGTVADQRIVTKSTATNGSVLVSRTKLDGFGRSYRQDSGYATSFADSNPMIESSVHTAYDVLGRVKWTSIPLPGDVERGNIGTARRTGFTYDILGRNILTTNPDGSTVATYYIRKPLVAGEYYYPTIATSNEDCARNTTGVPCLATAVSLDANGQVIVRRSLAPAGNEALSSTTPVRASTFYRYDAAGRLIGVTDPEGAVWEYRYNTVGDRTYSSDPGLGVWTLRYDVNHNLEQQEDAKDQAIEFEYDVLNRVLSKTVTGTTGAAITTTFTYDGNGVPPPPDSVSAQYQLGRLSTQSLPGHSIAFGYDASGNIAKTIHTVDDQRFVFETAYSASGLPTEIKAPYLPGATRQVMATFSYDSMDRLASARGGPTDALLIDSVYYDLRGLPLSTNFSNGLFESITYDQQRGWIDSIELGDGTGAMDLSVSRYSRAASGRIASVETERVEGNYIYTYDVMGRLVNAANGAMPQAFTYDRAGRMTSNSLVGTYVYGPSAPFHAPQAITGRPLGAADQSLTYDPNGNMLAGFGGKAMTYDAENRPLSVTLGGKKTCYIYGADGGRLKKIEAETTTLDCANPVATGGEITLYVGSLEIRGYGTAAEVRLAYPLGNIRLTNGVPGWLHTDALGSVRAVSDATGVVESSIYKPYGEQSEWGDAGPDESKGWIGERYDADAGLQYLNARYYDPQLGLFLQPDWFEVTEAGTNRFAYAYDDPVNLSDPEGNCPFCIVVAAITLFGSSIDPANAPGPGDATLPSNGDRNMLIAAGTLGAARLAPAAVSAITMAETVTETEEGLALTGVQANAAVGAEAEREVIDSLENQGLIVQPRVTLTNGDMRCVADCVISGTPGQTVQVPDGYTVESLSGKPLLGSDGGSASTITLNSNGQAVIEVKTGNAVLTSNQAAVYPSVTAGDAVGVGVNAARADVSGNFGSTSVYVLRKD
ncbi:hypothetical protein GCM10007315_32560 [Gemmobacter tilapiae]|uniref:Insecticide toxin TcdB middle/N-terminal domain-containing protein n=1 Tax=Neogemmobacter tilapiae TaxID=875041 RepID=A0A918WQS4_9RHOB|nr:hypothetical protein GCM10007315_32560 [Gemmobacter tilapiae]